MRGTAAWGEFPPVGAHVQRVQALECARSRIEIRRHLFRQDDFKQPFVARLAARIGQALKLALLPLAQLRRIVRMIDHETLDHLIERPGRYLGRHIGGTLEFERT